MDYFYVMRYVLQHIHANYVVINCVKFVKE